MSWYHVQQQYVWNHASQIGKRFDTLFIFVNLNWYFNTLRPRRNEQHFADDIFKHICLNENVWISIKISLKFVPKVSINNIPALVQIMAWCRLGDKPLSEPSWHVHRRKYTSRGLNELICQHNKCWYSINHEQSFYSVQPCILDDKANVYVKYELFLALTLHANVVQFRFAKLRLHLMYLVLVFVGNGFQFGSYSMFYIHVISYGPVCKCNYGNMSSNFSANVSGVIDSTLSYRFSALYICACGYSWVYVSNLYSYVCIVFAPMEKPPMVMLFINTFWAQFCHRGY